MSTNFPTSLDNTDSQKVTDGSSIIVAALPNNLLDMIEALQAKVGVNGSAVATSIDFFMRKNYVKVSDQKTNASGGTFSSGSWVTRTLNTEDHDPGGLCSLSINQITLASGTYRCRIVAPAYNVHSHIARLHNVTDDTQLLLGSVAYSDGNNTESIVTGLFTVGSSKALEVQHRCFSSQATYGLGRSEFTTISSVYTVAEFWKLY